MLPYNFDLKSTFNTFTQKIKFTKSLMIKLFSSMKELSC